MTSVKFKCDNCYHHCEISMKNSGVFRTYPVYFTDCPFFERNDSIWWLFDEQSEVDDDQG